MTTTKIFMDWEFMEDGRTIDPLSVGLVTENGEKLYIVVSDADTSKANDWVKENVLPHLYPIGKLFYTVPRVSLGAEIYRWVKNVCGDSQPEFWADYGAYDWLCLMQCYGPMVERPPTWPMFVRDIQQLRQHVGYVGKLPDAPDMVHHDAMDDALNVRYRYQFLKDWYGDQMPGAAL